MRRALSAPTVTPMRVFFRVLYAFGGWSLLIFDEPLVVTLQRLWFRRSSA